MSSLDPSGMPVHLNTYLVYEQITWPSLRLFTVGNRSQHDRGWFKRLRKWSGSHSVMLLGWREREKYGLEEYDIKSNTTLETRTRG